MSTDQVPLPEQLAWSAARDAIVAAQAVHAAAHNGRFAQIRRGSQADATALDAALVLPAAVEVWCDEYGAPRAPGFVVLGTYRVGETMFWRADRHGPDTVPSRPWSIVAPPEVAGA